MNAHSWRVLDAFGKGLNISVWHCRTWEQCRSRVNGLFCRAEGAKVQSYAQVLPPHCHPEPWTWHSKPKLPLLTAKFCWFPSACRQRVEGAAPGLHHTMHTDGSVMCPSHAPFTSFAQCSLNHRVPRLPAFTWNHLLVSKQGPAGWEAWAEAEEPLYGPASARNALWLQWAPPGLQPATGPDNDTGSSTEVCRHCMVSAAPSDLGEASWFYLQLSNLTAGDGAGIASAHGKFQPCVWLCSSWGCCEHGDLSENFAASIITAVTRQLAQTGAVWANRVRLVRVAWYLNSTAMRAELGSKHTVMERQGAGWGTAKHSMADCKQ